ncbi:gifsy-1 prophage terminase large chaing gp2 [Escherichia coli EC1738]|nr:gifsy-1 prophage terminase large chaing gp2 [Escherichia coli EC1738]
MPFTSRITRIFFDLTEAQQLTAEEQVEKMGGWQEKNTVGQQKATQ